MDTVTQALLGAVVGQAGFSHKLGRRACVWGAVGGLLPDLDVVAAALQGPTGEFLHHRGVTHALWFGPVVGPLLGYAVWRHYARVGGKAAPPAAPGPNPASPLADPGDPSLRGAWMGLFTLALFTHPLIDVFTSYGTQLLAPFSNRRFALDAVGIIDVIYSGILVISLLCGWALRRNAVAVRRVGFAALVLSWTYLGYGYALGESARREVARELAAEGITGAQVRAYPTLLQPYLRRIVVRNGDEIRIGVYTPWHADGAVWQRFRAPAEHPLIHALLETREGALFRWFAMGQIVAHLQPVEDGFSVEIDDLRYGRLGVAERGLWGIRGHFDRGGSLRTPIEFVTHADGSRLGEALAALWRAAWGDFSRLGLEPG